MSAPAPHRPLPIKVMNTVGGLAATVGLKPSLTPESIMAAAAKKTGLDDFGPDTFRPGLDALCWSLEHEAELHTLGRIAARASLLGRMEARLQLIDWRKKHPEVFEEKIEKPIFVLGLPRTGTTVLYGLLAANPALRDPVTWEVNSPVPPPRPDDAAAGDPRVEVSRKSMAGLRQLAPAVDAIHPMGEMLPQECITLHMPEFHSYEAVVTFHVPGYFEFLKREGIRNAYEFQRNFLQHLQTGYGTGQTWILKSPAHMMWLEDLMAVFPTRASYRPTATRRRCSARCPACSGRCTVR